MITEEEAVVVAVAEVDPAEVEEVDKISIQEVHPLHHKSNATTMVITIQIDHRVQCHQEHTIDNSVQIIIQGMIIVIRRMVKRGMFIISFVHI